MNEEHVEKVYMIREATAIQKLNMDVQAASDRLATIESGDILVTATTATEPIIHGAEIKKGVYVAHLGNNEVDEELILRADKVVIDDWETDKHRMGDTMACMFRDGKIDDSRIDASVSDLVAGRKSGRDNGEDPAHAQLLGQQVDKQRGKDLERHVEHRGFEPDAAHGPLNHDHDDAHEHTKREATTKGDGEGGRCILDGENSCDSQPNGELEADDAGGIIDEGFA